MTKKTYSQPKLNVYGDVEVLTQQTTSGTKLDQNLSAGQGVLNSLFS